MLHIYTRLRELPFEALTEIFRETLEKKGPFFASCNHLYDYLEECFFPRGGIYFLWEQEGAFVSAARVEPVADGWLLNALETHPRYRRREYGTALMEAITAYAREKSLLPLCSHVEKSNSASMSLHLSCGFRRISDCATYLDGTVTTRAATLEYR